jgi:hypothetical protein
LARAAGCCDLRASARALRRRHRACAARRGAEDRSEWKTPRVDQHALRMSASFRGRRLVPSYLVGGARRDAPGSTHAPALAHVSRPTPRRAHAPSRDRASAPSCGTAPATRRLHRRPGVARRPREAEREAASVDGLDWGDRTPGDRRSRAAAARSGDGALHALRFAPQDHGCAATQAPGTAPPPAGSLSRPAGVPSRCRACALAPARRPRANASRRGRTHGASAGCTAPDRPPLRACAARIAAGWRGPRVVRRRTSRAALGGSAAPVVWPRRVGHCGQSRHPTGMLREAHHSDAEGAIESQGGRP